jgi:glycosyltransferase involved in cell wall biosynthesis
MAQTREPRNTSSVQTPSRRATLAFSKKDTQADKLQPAAVTVLQLALPHYRQQFLDCILEQASAKEELTFLVGDEQFDIGWTTAVDSSLVHRSGTNRFFAGRRLAWQPGVVRPAVAADTAVVELNPRLLSTWFVLAARSVLRRKTLAWGHAWPRAGQYARSDRLRRVVRNLSDGLIVYTDQDRDALLVNGYKKPIYVASNAIVRSSQQRAIPRKGERSSLVWIGRLVAAKKPRLAIDAFRLAIPELRESTNLIIVGDGPERDGCIASAEDLVRAGRVRFLGEIVDEPSLAELFGSALATIASGYVGLNATQSIGYGCPIVYPTGEPHAPEIAALNKSNSLSFPQDDEKALARAMIEIERANDRFDREAISQRTRDEYSAERMASNFLQAVSAAT